MGRFTAHLDSDEFATLARHPDHPNAFTRHRKLPLPTLIAVMVSGMRQSVQSELDRFFSHLSNQVGLDRFVDAQAFANARKRMAPRALEALNHWLIAQADPHLPRWQGLRVVAADGTDMRFGLRASNVDSAAKSNQRGFGLYLPGAELMLAASLHSVLESEQQILFQYLDLLSSSDLLILDRGFPCRWLVRVLTQRNIPFCIRVDKCAFVAVSKFMRSDLPEATVTLPSADAKDAASYACDTAPTSVRLVRNIAPNGKMSVVMTNLVDQFAFPAKAFGDLYHQRWRIEEAFKRLKHRLNLEHVTGLSQTAVCQDFTAKVLCDNLQGLISLAAIAKYLPKNKHVNRAYAHTVLKPVIPRLLLALRDAKTLLNRAVRLIATNLQTCKSGLSKPRKPDRVKPHKYMSQKPC